MAHEHGAAPVVRCEVCSHRCSLREGQLGLCRVRRCVDGAVVCENYGQLTSLALDPIEKKPLARFWPGSMILSAGSYGCNFRCPWCQNHIIAQVGMEEAQIRYVSPEELVALAEGCRDRGNIGIAFTYNEPTIAWEYIRDCGRLSHDRGMKNVLVTNGSLELSRLRSILPLIDAMNVDLKGFREELYREIAGDLEAVKAFIACAEEQTHVEVTTLIVPGWNDREEEMEALADWLRSLSPDIPLHVSRFFPRYRMAGAEPTPVETVYRLAEVARRRLNDVFTGNC